MSYTLLNKPWMDFFVDISDEKPEYMVHVVMGLLVSLHVMISQLQWQWHLRGGFVRFMHHSIAGAWSDAEPSHSFVQFLSFCPFFNVLLPLWWERRSFWFRPQFRCIIFSIRSGRAWLGIRVPEQTNKQNRFWKITKKWDNLTSDVAIGFTWWFMVSNLIILHV